MLFLLKYLIFQLFYKDQTDFDLLIDIIDEFKTDKDFFIQKAIGWSLRQYGKTNKEKVIRYLTNSDLKGVALREASKYLK